MAALDLATVAAFPFTEQRIAAALNLAARGEAGGDSSGRRRWRDSGSADGLVLRAGRGGGAFYWWATRGGRTVQQRIGDATRMKLSDARRVAKRLAGGDDTAKPKPIRMDTSGPRVADVWAAYMAESRAGQFSIGSRQPRESTLRSYEQLYEPHIGRPYGKKSLAQLAAAVPTIHRGLAAKPATQKRAIQIISNLFVFARKRKHWHKPDPTVDPDTGKRMQCVGTKPRARVLAVRELKRLLAVAESQPFPWCCYWPLLLLTSVRKSSLQTMRWADLDLDATPPTWALEQTKTDAHTVPLSDAAVEYIRAIAATGRQSEWVFPQRYDATKPIADVDHAWAAIKREAGLTNARIHDLRRTAATLALRGGMSLPAVQRAGGWKTISAVAVYARADLSDGQRAAEIVAGVVDSIRGGE